MQGVYGQGSITNVGNVQRVNMKLRDTRHHVKNVLKDNIKPAAAKVVARRAGLANINPKQANQVARTVTLVGTDPAGPHLLLAQADVMRATIKMKRANQVVKSVQKSIKTNTAKRIVKRVPLDIIQIMSQCQHLVYIVAQINMHLVTFQMCVVTRTKTLNKFFGNWFRVGWSGVKIIIVLFQILYMITVAENLVIF